jgi:transcriptional regulator with XRE-family HTH domain
MNKMTVLEARTALGVTSRYALAKRLGISPSAANKWRRPGATKRNDKLDPLPELRALQVEKIVREAGRTD